MSSNPDFSKLPNLYKVLGVSSSTPGDEFDREVKKNYRRLARENHPDRLRELPEAERKERTEKMYLINAAHEVLKNPEKRTLYDQWRKETKEGKIREGAIRSRRAASFEEIFNALFKDIMRGSVFGEGGRQTLFGDWGFGWSRQKEIYDYLLMPENDWGLLSALITAYQTEDDGKWKVKRTETDQRKWMPESVYVVRKEEGKVSVFRKITDWRSKWDREEVIKVHKAGEPWKVEKEIDPSRYLGEYYLHGGGRIEGCTTPSGYGEYLTALKSLAGKIARKEKNAEGNYDVQKEVQTINEYTRSASRTRDEGSTLFDDYELRKKVPFDDFWTELKRAEGRVVQIGGQRTVEGQAVPAESKG